MYAQTDDMILAAGGLLSADARPPEGRAVDAVTARSYAHAALPGRVVVRLSAESVAQGDDLEMSVLGFEAPVVSAPVGLERRRPLGFPAWPIVHDPKNARYALDVVKELKKAARKAKSKPGHSKEAFDSLGDTLARSVPHFLPSFFEEVGRAFIDAGAQKFAAQYFEKAREAERVHALDIDEDARRDAFLEFALAGAVSIKSLAAYAKDLEKSRTPEVAYTQFRRLCIQRTLGGMPPWGSMGKELARLAKLAKRDVAFEEASLLGEIVESPSLAKAPPEFWKVYRKSLVSLARGSASVRGTLLNLFPSAAPGEWDEEWLALLDECGALDALYDATADAASQPSAGPAAWISRAVLHAHRGWRGSIAPRKLFEILEKAAPRLREEGAPVAFRGKWRGRVLELDLTEHALALGVPVAPPGEHAELDLTEWSQRASLPGRGADPVHVAKDARFSALFDAALPRSVGTEPFESVARGKAGLAAARRAWLDRTIASAVTGAMPSLDASVSLLAERTRAQTYVEFPEPYAALATIDPVVCLARSLRGGIFDEWGWPAYDAAARDLGGDEKHIEVHGAFPYACLYLNGRVFVISPKERVLEHDVRLGKGEEVTALRYAQGQLLVVKQNAGYETVAYWSGAPGDEFSVEHHWELRSPSFAIELPDGSLSEGGRALRAGDRSLSRPAAFVSDGTTMWIREWVNGTTRLREVHPKTGEKGRVSLPSFFERWSRDGMALDLRSSWLVPLPSGLSSPFGSRGGLAGVRVRTRTAAVSGSDLPWCELESVDGRVDVPTQRRTRGALRARDPAGREPPVARRHENALAPPGPRHTRGSL